MMKKAFTVINSLIDEKIIVKYALAGSFATLFYIEPTVTYDLDILVVVNNTSMLEPLKELYNWARSRNYEIKDEHIIIEGIPVQFLPVYSPLIIESVERSFQREFENVPVKVLSPEYLVAIMIEVNREKDRQRAVRFFEECKTLNLEKLKDIIERFGLTEKYHKFRERYLL